MHILIAIIIVLALMAGLVVAVAVLAASLARGAGYAMERGPMQSGAIPMVAYGLLWLLIAGTAAGFIGGG